MNQATQLIADVLMDEVIYAKGYEAGQQGLDPRTANHYRSAESRHTWNLGYSDAMLGVQDSVKACQEIITNLGV
jgi:ribosome modulation factor